MLRFHFPECFLLAIPLAWVYWRWCRPVDGDRVTEAVRIGLLLLLLLAFTGPEVNLGGLGLDVVVVADRSASMTDGDIDSIRELIQNLDNTRASGDRVGIVGFGLTPSVERQPSGDARFAGFEKNVSPEGSDLNEALLTALNLVDRNRPARILALTDGEATGLDPRSAARRARELGVPIDFRDYTRLRTGDIAIEAVSLPETVSPREPFQFSVRVFADTDSDAEIRILRDDQEFATRTVSLHSGMNVIPFREVLERGGFYKYTAEVIVENDPLPENNRGLGVVRVDAGPRVLVLNADGQAGNMVRALQAASIPVDVSEAKSNPLMQDDLDPYRTVILENVPADDLGRLKMERLAQFVEDLGGGLLITGGRKSFGGGGYYKSPLDPVLPVSMELREEHRKMRVAIAVVLDRSGSMSAPVRGGQTKMDLANIGTSEVVRLLSSADMVSVIAVDSAPHVVQDITRVDDAEAIVSRVKRIESMGGGIFVYDALVAAGEQLMQAEGYQTRHIILFSDATDSEEPGAYETLLDRYSRAGMTVSVIGLGSDTDVDAGLLKDIAKRGGGNIMFTDDAAELPRLFTQDTMSVARSTFIEAGDEYPNGIPGELLPEPARLMGEIDFPNFPTVGGYNLSYLKPDATAAALSRDEYAAPWSAFWYRGLGRVAALTMEVDGLYTGRFGSWSHYDDFLITHVRWLLGGDNPNDVFIDLQRDGQTALITVELDPTAEQTTGRLPTNAPALFVVPPGAEREEPLRPEFTWIGSHTLQAQFAMNELGTYRTLVKTGGRQFTRGPALTLPYSPEFEPRPSYESGRSMLAELADLSGGERRTDVVTIFKDPPSSPRMLPLLPYLMILAATMLLTEIAGRRLVLWKRTKIPTAEPLPSGGPLPPPKPAKKRKVEWAFGKRRPSRKATTTVSSSHADREQSRSSKPSAGDIYAQAKQKARRRHE
ncbi:vWA domain-containing protein [Thalassoroseus pseudoceratinae]|uniref:vWA domain-containing protein n=1 Tax=Thalassoroseus pseudoceratinae TaxID=2713176 RepID=UPI00141DB216|nr:vWA domain-containing protein [Thalassoroseus pseudoceratinae]